MAYTKRPLSEKETVAKKHDETAEEFEARFSSMASSAYTILGVALGDRLGLFRQMASMKKPWTPKELADAGNWKERLVLVCVQFTENWELSIILPTLPPPQAVI